MRLHFTTRGRDDLFEIWSQIATNNSQTVADRISDRILGACAKLRHHPHLGAARPDIREGAEALVIGRWLALYRIEPTAALIVRIVDGARDLSALQWIEE